MSRPAAPTPAFTAPTNAPVPSWAAGVDPWCWEAVEGVWTRWLTRRVGGDVTAVDLSAVQNAGADGAVHTSQVFVALPSEEVQREEVRLLGEALLEAAILLEAQAA